MPLQFGADRQLVQVVADCDSNIPGKYNNGKKFARAGEPFWIELQAHLEQSCRFKEGRGRTTKYNDSVAQIATTYATPAQPESDEAPKADAAADAEAEKKSRKAKKKSEG